MYCQGPPETRKFAVDACEHFGDNVPHASLYPVQGEPKMFTEVGETALATRRPPEKPTA
jgi:hypothetical protein